MRQGLIERRRMRREIRRINRETRVDYQEYRHRAGVLVVLALCIFAFIIFEIFSILQSKHIHDQELAKKLADQTTIELSQINTSFISNNQTAFRDAHRQYRKYLVEFNSNDYMKNNQVELLEQLNAYERVLTEEENTAHLIKLHTTIVMLRKELGNISLKDASVKSMIEIKESFKDFRDSLDELHDKRFQDLIFELASYSDEMISIIDKAAICAGSCTKKTMQTYSQELINISAKYQEKLIGLDIQVSASFSPTKLVESLKMLQ